MNENVYESEVETEILALDSIYGDKLKYDAHERTVKITIYPATAENMSSQYVCLPITFLLPKDYPETSPEIIFSTSRGLSDTTLQSLHEIMCKLANDRCGECILFDLIDMAKDSLTTNNIPSCLCSICLSGFQEGDDFLKTDCYHYFHCHCMNEYYNHLQKTQEKEEKDSNKIYTDTLPCPVCRVIVTVDTNLLKEAKAPLHDAEPEVDLLHVKQQNSKFDKIFEKQLKNGGLIDLEYEQKKYLLSTMQQEYENRIASSNASENSDASSKSHESDSKPEHKSDQQKSSVKKSRHYISSPRGNPERKNNDQSSNNKPYPRKHFSKSPEYSNCANKEKQDLREDQKDTTRKKKTFYYYNYRPESCYSGRSDGRQANTRWKCHEKTFTTDDSQEQRKNFDANQRTNQYNNGQVCHQSHPPRTKNNYYKKYDQRPHSQQNQSQFKSDNRHFHSGNRHWHPHKRQAKPTPAAGLTSAPANNKSDAK